MICTSRFAYSDYALAQALRLCQLDNLNINITYDSACSYSINIRSRFSDNLKDLEPIIANSHFTIDSLHVNNHIKQCMYLYSSAYKECMAHFHGVGTKQYWSENNQMGPQTHRMNKGHRQDKITEHHSNWNWKKTIKMGNIPFDIRWNTKNNADLAMTLANELTTARSLYIQKRDFFKKLSDIHRKHVPKWYRMDHSPRIRPNRDVESVYRHLSPKGMYVLKLLHI